MYRAYATRAAEFHDGSSKPEWDNTPIIQRMLELRRRRRAACSASTTLPKSRWRPRWPTRRPQVLAFLRELAAKAKPFAEKDIAELRAFASDELGLADFQPWDAAYVSEKLLQARYAFSEQEVKQYFTEPKVLAGLFKVIETLFGVTVKPDTAPVWHEDVRFYRIEDAGRRAGRPVLPRPLRPRNQARRRLDGRSPLAAPGAQRHPDADGLPQLQLLAPGRRQAGDFHPRRSHHAVPRNRPRPAPPADARRGTRRIRHPRRRMGCRRTALAVHGKLLLGMGSARRA